MRWWPAGLAALLLAVYGRGLSSPYFADDFQFLFGPDPPRMMDLVLLKNPSHRFYRPLEAIALAVIQAHWGVNALPVHLLALLLHGALCAVVLLALRRGGWGDGAAAIACLVMAVSQANVLAVASVDTLSQIGATLFGSLAVWLLATRRFDPQGPEGGTARGSIRRSASLPVFAFVVSLLCKETAVSMLPVLLLTLLLRARESPGARRSGAGLIRSAAPYLGALAIYLLLRRAVIGSGPGWGSDRYDLRLGINVLRNLAEMAAAVLAPVSSVDLVQALRAGAPAFVGLAGLAAAIVAMLVWWGARRSRRRPWLAGVAFGSVSALFPMAAMNHVSELYVYNAMPFVSVLIGVGFDAALRAQRRAPARAVVATLLGCFMASHVGAVQSKLGMMRRNGERAAELVTELKPWVERLPSGAQVVLVNPDAVEPDYSVYVMHGLTVLKEGERGIAILLRRPDLGLRVLSIDEAVAQPPGPVMLTLRDGDLAPFPVGGDRP